MHQPTKFQQCVAQLLMIEHFSRLFFSESDIVAASSQRWLEWTSERTCRMGQSPGVLNVSDFWNVAPFRNDSESNVTGVENLGKISQF